MGRRRAPPNRQRPFFYVKEPSIGLRSHCVGFEVPCSSGGPSRADKRPYLADKRFSFCLEWPSAGLIMPCIDLEGPCQPERTLNCPERALSRSPSAQEVQGPAVAMVHTRVRPTHLSTGTHILRDSEMFYQLFKPHHGEL